MIALGIGSNQGNRKKFLLRAIQKLRLQGVLTDFSCSAVFESAALLPAGAPASWDRPFLNLVVCGKTSLGPLDLLQAVKKIEKKLGRSNRERWSPREIDIDILQWNNENFEIEGLQIPHAGLMKRPFALLPLLQVKKLNEFPVDVQNEISRVLGDWQIEMPFNTREISWRADFPQLMGIVNVTPDSFSDGGLLTTTEQALAQIRKLLAEGATIVDIGAESTRPGAQKLKAEAELTRVRELIPEALKISPDLEISIDTYHWETARLMRDLGVHWLNDVSGFSDKKMIEVVGEGIQDLVFMHNLGIPADKKVVMSADGDVVMRIRNWAASKIEDLLRQGISRERLIFDPGIGFGKTPLQNLQILSRIQEFSNLGVRILVGHSRKSFLEMVTALPPAERDIETLATSISLIGKVDYLRVHNVAIHQRAFLTLQKLGDA